MGFLHEIFPVSTWCVPGLALAFSRCSKPSCYIFPCGHLIHLWKTWISPRWSCLVHRKTNMEPKNHPIEKEHIIFQSVSYSNTFSFCNLSKICVTIHPWGGSKSPNNFSWFATTHAPCWFGTLRRAGRRWSSSHQKVSWKYSWAMERYPGCRFITLVRGHITHL